MSFANRLQRRAAAQPRGEAGPISVDRLLEARQGKRKASDQDDNAIAAARDAPLRPPQAAAAAAAPVAARAIAQPQTTRAARRAEMIVDERDGSQIEHLRIERDAFERRIGFASHGDDVAAKEKRSDGARKDGRSEMGRRNPYHPVDNPYHAQVPQTWRRSGVERAGQEEEIAGPFFASSKEDVVAVKRALLEQKQAERQQRRAAVKDYSSHDPRSLPSNPADPLGPVYRRSVVKDDAPAGKERAVDARIEAGRRSDVPWMDIETRQTQAQETCYVGNEILSCYPTANTQVAQGTYSKFIWNYNYPRFRQIGFVDIYLFREDTDQIQTSWLSVNNNLQRISFEPNDPWWSGRPRADDIQPGQNISWPFYFVITGAGLGLDSSTISRLSTFSAIQTAVPSSVVAAQEAASASASSASAASASAASLSSASAALSDSSAIASFSSSLQSSLSRAIQSSLNSQGLTSTETAAAGVTTTLPNGSIITASATAQANGGTLAGRPSSNSNGLAIPVYAIVLISVLGFFALLGVLVVAYFLSRAARKRRERAAAWGSYGSSSPMMRGVDGGSVDDGGAGFGSSAGAGAAGAGAGAAAAAAGARSRSSGSSHDSHPFSSDEATRMADAFRNALRKPEFPAAFSSDNNSPNEGDELRSSPELRPTPASVMRDELASEGKGLKAVERGRPTVHDE